MDSVFSWSQSKSKSSSTIFANVCGNGYNELNGDGYNEPHSQFDFDLQLPTGMDTFYAFQSPNATPKMNRINVEIKPRLNSKLPSPQYRPLRRPLTDNKHVQLSKLLPPPQPQTQPHSNFKLIPMMSSNSYKTIASIKSDLESVTLPITQRTSMNSWPSQQSILNLNNCLSSRSQHTQIRATDQYSQQLSPIYDEDIAFDTQHLTQLVQELTDDEESEIENEIDDTINDDMRPRLATIVSQQSSVNSYGHVYADPLINVIDATYSFVPSSQRTSRTITTTATNSTFDDNDNEDVNVAFEYIPDDDDHDDAMDEDEDAIEAMYSSRGMDVLMQRDFAWFDFEFMDNIGRGAYGVVDKSFHLKSCQIVAMKRSRSLKKRMMDSFKREVLICAEFADCPYIINMIECGIDESKNEICCALEYMNCASLSSRKRYTLHEIQTICFCVLSALCALHSKLYVHNDIKPDNILFNTAFDVKLTDFGCCQRMRDAQTPLRQPNGSLMYQSYEKKFVSPIEYTTQSVIRSKPRTWHVVNPFCVQ
eukprot:222515_1